MSDTFEQVLAAAQAEGSLTAAWKKFVNTKFFVQVVRSADNDPKKLTLHLARGPEAGAPVVRISEVRERLDQPPGASLATLSGADVVRMLHAEAAILVALNEDAFTIAKDRVDWLKKGIEAAQARAAAKAQQAPVAPAPVPAPVVAPVVAPLAAPVSIAKPAAPPPALAPLEASPARRNAGAVLDVAALKPRSVTLAQVGLEFFVPGDWQEIRSNKALKFTDAASGSVLEASGSHRPDMSLAQWQTMRMALVAHEMRYMVQDGAPYPIDGEGWRDRVKGMATEFTGTFPGDEFVSRYLVACIRIDGTVASIAIRAPADAFEHNRALYKWLLSRVDLLATAAVEMRTSAARPGGTYDGGDDMSESPAIFGMSLRGRISRLQAMAYSFPLLLAFSAAFILAAVVGPKNFKLAIGIMISAGLAWTWLAMRLLVLRLHDANISGKWILYFFGAVLGGSIFKMYMLVGLIVLLGVLVTSVFYMLVPGSGDDNDFGPPPAENSGLVKVGAFLYIMLILANGTGGVKNAGRLSNPMSFAGAAGSTRAAAAGDSATFTTPDGSFSVDMPGTPAEVAMPPEARAQMGRADMHMYQLIDGNGAYMAQTIDYGRATLDRVTSTRAIEQNLVGAGGTLLSSRMILMNGQSGRDVRVSLPNGLMRGSRFIIVGSKILSVTVTTRSGAAGEAVMDGYLTSFTLP